MKAIVFIDVQNDFIDGALPVDKDHKIAENIVKYAYINKCEHVPLIATRDTHQENYLDTFEGKNLPVKHCIENTDGWKLFGDLNEYIPADNVINKITFGSSVELPAKIGDIDYNLTQLYGEDNGVSEIEICGYCTDICVISNALILRATYPNLKITILENLCAGTTPENHEAALKVARSNQIDVRKSICV